MFTVFHKPPCVVIVSCAISLPEPGAGHQLNFCGGSGASCRLRRGLAIADVLSRNKNSVCNNSMTDILINGMSIDGPYD